MNEIDLQVLAAEFPRASVSWRAQSMTAAGDRAMALCYIDARDVMDRLDSVCGPENWQDRYEFHGSRTVCYLSLRINGEWITKADGAGDSDVEAEKGAISDALKRAAVKWGVGRYLYAMPTPWVQCEHYEKGGKKYWKAWKEDPWSQVRLLKPAERSSEPRVAANPVVGNIGGEGGTALTRGPATQDVDTATVYARLWTKMETLDGDALIKWQNRPEVAEAFKGLPEKERLNLNDAINQKLGK